MKLDDELKALLRCKDTDDEMRNDAFIETVMAGIKPRHRRRRVIVASTGSLATLAAMVAWMSLPPVVMSAASVDMRSIMAVLALAALCGVAWLRTQVRSNAM